MRRGAARAETPSGGNRRHLTFEGWQPDLMRHELRDPHGVIIDLSAGEFDLLLALVEAPNRILTRDYLIAAGVKGAIQITAPDGSTIQAKY